AAALETGVLRRSDLARFIEMALESSDLLLANSQRAADLIKSFKQVAVDQTSDDRRAFDLAGYIDEVLMSLRPRLKRSAVAVSVICPQGLIIEGYPGPLAQVLTNFLMNSLVHAYGPDQAGRIEILVECPSPEAVRLVYGDDGKGIPDEVLPKIFDPFFTTNRVGGGSGLGLNIVYNLVTQRLRGRIEVESRLGRGTSFIVHFPRVM
ncbi:MAG: HAMP domain-containing sensor histidine kinase, partial [Rhodospirillaceae bacterium]